MKPAPFDYVRANSIEEACALLAEDEDGRLIAGGQTLVPMLAMRLARPSRLIDILRVPELAGIRQEESFVVTGATTRQVTAEHHPLVAAEVPLLARAMPWVGHPPTRNRGTVGGSIANADPAAELPLVAVTLGAGIVVASREGTRTIPAGAFFLGPMMTAVPHAACVSAIRWPARPHPLTGAGFHEVSARRSDFAFVAAAAQVSLDDAGTCIACAVGIGGLGEAPVRLDAVAAALIGAPLEDTRMRHAVSAAVSDLHTASDLHASAAYRRRVAAVLAQRALTDAREAAMGAGR